MRYLDVADAIRASISMGRYSARGSLASESDLARTFRVSRVTVRKALEVLREEGLVSPRKGAGWFLAIDQVRQALGRFATVEAALADAGLQARRKVIDFRFEAAPKPVALALGLGRGAEVLRVERIMLVGDDPFALVTVWVSAKSGEHLSRADVEAATFYDLLPLRGIELGGATQTITAIGADARDARLLGLEKGAPLLACARLTRSADGSPVIYSEHRYAARRTAFEVEFPRITASSSQGPSGLRLLSATRSKKRASAR